MLLCTEAAKEYKVLLLSGIHILSYVWNNMPTEIIANWHSVPVQFEACRVVETPDVAEDDDGRFDDVLSARVQLADYLAIDDGVVVAGQPSDDEIIRDALCDDGRAVNEDKDFLVKSSCRVALCERPRRPLLCLKTSATSLTVRVWWST